MQKNIQYLHFIKLQMKKMLPVHQRLPFVLNRNQMISFRHTGQLNPQIGERHAAVNFQAARNTCLAEGKQLLVIKDEKKDDLLQNHIRYRYQESSHLIWVVNESFQGRK